jgi:hypothetical protein
MELPPTEIGQEASHGDDYSKEYTKLHFGWLSWRCMLNRSWVSESAYQAEAGQEFRRGETT